MLLRSFAAAFVLVLLFAPDAHAYEARHVFITNRGGNNIVELDDNFEFQRVWFQGIVYEGQPLSVQNGMAFTPRDELFVADTGNDRIVAFDRDGEFIRAFSTLERLGRSVESIYFDGAGTMFASANPGLGTVARYDAEGIAGADVVMGDEFLNLGNVNLTEEGNVIVADFSSEGRGLRELDPATGAVIRTFGTDLSRQEDIMIDGADRVFVSHISGDEIVVFGPAPERTELYRFTAPGEPALVQPTGIALSHDCYILVASFINGAIFVFRHEGGSTPPVFDRVLRPGVEIPESAALSQTESIAISGLRLPGGFNEFTDSVPSCDPAIEVDGGLGMDAGSDAGSPGDAGVSVDASASDTGASDTGAQQDGGGTGDADGGCGCNFSSRTPSPALLLLGLALLWRRARK